MGSVTMVTPEGEDITITIRPGNTVMEAAIEQEVPGIEAQCYGAGICGTCHIYVREPMREKLPPKSDWEAEMIENLPLAKENSRLSCQLRFAEGYDGAVFDIPERQDAMS